MIGDYINNKTSRNNYQFRVESIPRCFDLLLLCSLWNIFFNAFIGFTQGIFFYQRIFLYKIFNLFFPVSPIKKLCSPFMILNLLQGSWFEKKKNNLNIPWGCFHSTECLTALMAKLFWEKFKKDFYQFLC